MTADKIEKVYCHLKSLGVSTENNLIITRDLELVVKFKGIFRRIWSVVSRLFPCFRHLREKTALPSVIHSIDAAVIKALAFEDETRQKAAFIVSVLRLLECGADPHLRQLTRLNQLSHKISTAMLSDAQKRSHFLQLQELESLYHRQDPAVDEATTNAFEEITQLEAYSLQKHQSEVDAKLLSCLTSRKNNLPLGAYITSPYFAMRLNAMPPDSESQIDVEKIDESLACGANINCQDSRTGYTPLIYAAYYGFPNILTHLLSKGASPEIKEHAGYNAYTTAKYYLLEYEQRLAREEQSLFGDTASFESSQRKTSMYVDFIRRYQEIVTLLEPLTVDQNMP